MEAFVVKFRFKAKGARMAQSRLKMLNKMVLLEDVTSEPTVVLQFPNPEPLSAWTLVCVCVCVWVRVCGCVRWWAWVQRCTCAHICASVHCRVCRSLSPPLLVLITHDVPRRAISFSLSPCVFAAIPVLELQDVSFGYGDSDLLFKDLNFTIQGDSRIALVGPNGVGKSTLLKLFTGEIGALSIVWCGGCTVFARCPYGRRRLTGQVIFSISVFVLR